MIANAAPLNRILIHLILTRCQLNLLLRRIPAPALNLITAWAAASTITAQIAHTASISLWIAATTGLAAFTYSCLYLIRRIA